MSGVSKPGKSQNPSPTPKKDHLEPKHEPRYPEEESRLSWGDISQLAQKALDEKKNTKEK
ncbi:MAG: hypothetical protein FJZ58_00920 [Chlamydiae bacterium]|nr:hypothetical protein [Chlamydiota bacterium]